MTNAINVQDAYKQKKQEYRGIGGQAVSRFCASTVFFYRTILFPRYFILKIFFQQSSHFLKDFR